MKNIRSEEHTAELQSRPHLVCRLLLECDVAPLDPHSFPTRRSSDLVHPYAVTEQTCSKRSGAEIIDSRTKTTYIIQIAVVQIPPVYIPHMGIPMGIIGDSNKNEKYKIGRAHG